MKNYFILIIVLLTTYSNAQFCPGNLFTNGDLELGTPTGSHQDINLAPGFSSIWGTGSLADFYAFNAGPGPEPVPATGNYAGLWISNNLSNTTYREGLLNEFVSPIASNTGVYSFTFDVACKLGWGSAEIGIYGIYNPTNAFSATPTTSHLPSNPDLYGPANTVLLGTIPLAATCNVNKVNHTITFDSGSGGFPTNGITHVLITHSDAVISGSRYVGLDNFCMVLAEPEVLCCRGRNNIINNGDFDDELMVFSPDFTHQPAAPSTTVLPGEYSIMNSTEGLTVSSNWDADCPGGGNHMFINGRTGQSGSSTFWETSLFLSEGTYSFCVRLKNLPQCDFDVKPVVSVLFSGGVTASDINNHTVDVNSTGTCDWETLGRMLEVPSNGVINIKMVLDETGLGDGNDLVIDDVLVTEINPVPAGNVVVNLTPFNISGSTFNISGIPTATLGRSCTDAWKVAELDANFNEIAGTVVDNPVQWQTNPTFFNGYNGTSTLSGTMNGVFDVSKRYRITFTRDCDCMLPNSSSWIYQPGPANMPHFVRENGRSLRNVTTTTSASKAQLSPNPAKDNLTIKVEQLQLNSVIRIYNINGELMRTVESIENKVEYDLNIADFPAGVYLVSIMSKDGESQSYKFVKE